MSGCDRLGDLFAKKPDIAYAPYGEGYASKPDLAQVEYEHPIPAAELAKITPRYLAGLEQEQLDQLYARLASGPIPDGAFDGEVVFPRGSSGRLRVAEIVGGFKGLAVDFKGKTLETLGEALWKGKVFYRDQKVLRNRIQDLAVLRPVIGPGDIPRRSTSTARTPGCCFRPSSTAARACSTRAASRSSSTMPSPTSCPAIASDRTFWPAGAACACGTKSAWCAPVCTWGAPTWTTPSA